MCDKIIITKEVEYYGKMISVDELKPSSLKKIIVKCPVCLNERESYYGMINRTGHTICLQCKRKEQRRILEIGDEYGELTVLTHSSPGKSICLCSCGKMTEKANYSLESGETMSCGHLRRNNKFKEILRGKHHPNWKGGISSKRERDMQTAKYKKWRESMYAKDNYTCQKCGQVGYKLNAHHIESYSDNPSLRYDVENGITMCEECHKDFHYIYGHYGFDKYDMKEYFKEENI